MSRIPRLYFMPEIIIKHIKREKHPPTERVIIEDKGNTLFVAHRGYSSFHMQNTIASFKAAGQKSFYGIETDTHVTKDGKYIIIHDDTTAAVSDVKVKVEECTFHELKNIKLKVKNGEDTPEATTMPSLQEYIEVCKECGKVAVLELKNHFEPENIKEIVEIIKEIGYIHKMVFISFDLPNCIELRKMDPTFTVEYLTTRYSKKLIKTLVENKLDLDIFYKEINEKRVKELHDNGIKLNVWTLDDPEIAKKFISYGVDFITTNIIE